MNQLREFTYITQLNDGKIMKAAIATLLSCVCLCSAVSLAEDAPVSEATPVIETSPAFDKLKNLVGDWKGEMRRSTGEVIDLKLSYKMVSNGSVIIEDAVEDDVEMITTYTDRFGKLTATHYCALGNQPMFNLSSMTASTLDFDFDPRCGLEEGKHKYVKDWKIIHDPKKPDVLVTEYVLINEDKTLETSVATLKKVK
jgi:hypothetical protein